MNKIKIAGELVVRCGRGGCDYQLPVPYETLKKEVDYADRGDLDGALATIAREAGWTEELVCPNHLDTGGKLASFGFDEGLRRNVVLLVLDEDEARTFAGQTFRVRVDPK